MKFRHFKYVLQADLYRVAGEASFKAFLKYYLAGEAFRYNVWLRAAWYTKTKGWTGLPFYFVSWLLLRRAKFRYGISICEDTSIGPGFYIGHFGGIVVSPKAVIGRNCNLSHGVTIGRGNRGPREGYPSIGDGVYIGPGAKIIGNVRIGDNVAIGANAVVITDIPSNSIAVGVPAKARSGGAEGYVNRTNYWDVLGPDDCAAFIK